MQWLVRLYWKLPCIYIYIETWDYCLCTILHISPRLPIYSLAILNSILPETFRSVPNGLLSSIICMSKWHRGLWSDSDDSMCISDHPSDLATTIALGWQWSRPDILQRRELWPLTWGLWVWESESMRSIADSSNASHICIRRSCWAPPPKAIPSPCRSLICRKWEVSRLIKATWLRLFYLWPVLALLSHHRRAGEWKNTDYYIGHFAVCSYMNCLALLLSIWAQPVGALDSAVWDLLSRTNQ